MLLSSFSEIPWLGVAASSLVSFAFGGIWFRLNGRAYSRALGRPHDPNHKPTTVYYVGPVVWSMVVSTTSALVMKALDVNRMGQAVELGLLVGLGFLAPTVVNTGINPNIPNKLLYGMVTGGYHVCVGVIMPVTILLTKAS